jgi:hypothetical protein
MPNSIHTVPYTNTIIIKKYLLINNYNNYQISYLDKKIKAIYIYIYILC